MKKLNKTVTVLIIAAISIGGVSVSAAGWAFKNGKMPFGKGKQKVEMNDSKKTERADKQKAEMTEKLKNELLEKLEKGEITQEEYDKQLEAIENGKFAPLGKGKREIPERADEQKAEMTEKLKNELLEKLEKGEITQEEYDKQLEAIENGTYKPKHAPDGKFGGKRSKDASEKPNENISE